MLSLYFLIEISLMSDIVAVSFLPVEYFDNVIFLRFSILQNQWVLVWFCFLGGGWCGGEGFWKKPLSLCFSFTPISVLICRERKKEIRGMGCEELLTCSARQQEKNWTQMTLAIYCKCFQLILQGFSLGTISTSHLFLGSPCCEWPTSHACASIWQVTESVD